VRRDTIDHFTEDLRRWRSEVYNAVRPHEALGDQPPITRWHPSRRPRPAKLPQMEYASGTELRKVAGTGDIRWHCARILVGRGLTGEWVQVEPTEQELIVRYGTHEIRRIALTNLASQGML
jgi:hypothetical protein